MRLSCPNCDAQYEVPADVIPVEGRDVQCSNCGQTWFQHHPDHVPEPEPEPAPEPEAVAEERVAAPPDPETEHKAREIDPSIAEILRQEAAQEVKAREADALESQPELGLDDVAATATPQTPEPEPEPAPDPTEAERRSREAQERMARMRGETPAPELAAAAAAGATSRRDLLPDIEEINSTLRSAGDRQSAAGSGAGSDSETVVKAKQRSFRRGFALSITVVALFVGLYVATPRIIEAVPATEPALLAYTAQVDTARIWLDGQVTRFLTWMDGMETG
ncbi:MAG: zinc-ribbon domain-containing protein [Pseudomonadota bacterium]